MNKKFESLSQKREPQKIQNENSPMVDIDRSLQLEAEALSRTRRIENQAVNNTLESIIDEKIEGSIFGNVPVFVHNLKRTIAAGIFALGMNVGDVFAGEKAEQLEFSPAQTQVLESITGVTLPELIDKFEVQIPVESDSSGKYIIHIGQTHQHPDGEIMKSITQGMVIERQKAIEDLMQKIVKANNLEGIFLEGVDNGDTQSEIQAYIKRGIEGIDELYKKEINSLESLLAAYNFYQKYQQNIRHPQIYHYLGSKLLLFREKILTDIKESKITTYSADEKLFIETISTGLVLDKDLTEFLMLGEQSDAYTVGIGFKFLMEDKIKYIYPAESADLNKKAFAAKEKREKASSEYSKKYQLLRNDVIQTNIKAWERRNVLMKKGQNMTDEEKAESEAAISVLKNAFESLNAHPELSELAFRLNQAKDEEKRAIFTEREAEILRRVDLYDKQKINDKRALENILLQYGRNHDLAEVLMEWNAKNPSNSIDRGLIKIAPKD